MTTRIDISIGPVQGFVAQSRRTRDLWGSSYLLSFLSAHAMHGAAQAGGRIVQPVVDDDPLYGWVAGQRNCSPPRIGSVPNHFVVETDGDGRRVAREAEKAFKAAWKQVCKAVWKRFVEHACPAGDGTDHIWSRQIDGFWEVMWTAGPSSGSSGALLARRKHWRSHRLPDEPGDKCTVMPDLQELSGHVRAESPTSRESQDRFWRRVREHMGSLDLRENERLCAVAFVKRLFPKVASQALGWDVEASHWPSTVYVGAVPWIRRVVRVDPKKTAAAGYAVDVMRYAGQGVLPMHQPPFGLDASSAGDFPKLDANYFHEEWVKDEVRCPLTSEHGNEEREKLVRSLEAIYKTEDQDGNQLGRPSLFYALLLADGDRLGKLVGESGGKSVGRALAAFTRKVPEIVKRHYGVTVYAGGDDVLAMLPVSDALSCAAALSDCYRSAFEGQSGATLSAAVVFAHVRLPLKSVLETAHRLLDDVAKDGNGRDSLAAEVLNPGGTQCQWATTWTRKTSKSKESPAVARLHALARQLESVTSEPGLSSALLYRIREMLGSLCGWEQWEPGAWGEIPKGLDIRAFLRAEILHSLGVRMEEGAETRADEVTDLVLDLLMRSQTSAEGRKNGKTESDEAGVDALLLARFLATSGHEEADR